MVAYDAGMGTKGASHWPPCIILIDWLAQLSDHEMLDYDDTVKYCEATREIANAEVDDSLPETEGMFVAKCVFCNDYVTIEKGVCKCGSTRASVGHE